MNSEYHWQRRNNREIRNLFGVNGTGDMKFDECIAKYFASDYRKCFIWNMQNYMVHFFCGQSGICQDPSLEALELAKRRIEQHFGIIGDIDDFKTFFKMLEICLPQYFSGADRMHYQTIYAKDRQRNSASYTDVPSIDTVNYLKNVLKYEYELYYFIRQRHYAFIRYLQIKGYDV